MSQELEEQQRISRELKEQLRSLEAERVRITEQIRIIEAKLLVQELRNKVKVKTEEINQLRVRKQELEERLESKETTPVIEEQIQVTPRQEESSYGNFRGG
jgi:predicted nuclease with TOPRIM domain